VLEHLHIHQLMSRGLSNVD